MYNISELKSMLFIDIETASQYVDFNDLKSNGPAHMEDLWIKKAESIRLYEPDKKDLDDDTMYIKTASLYPEFGKINTISIGQIKFNEAGEPVSTNIRSFYGDDEPLFLNEFLKTMSLIFLKNPNIQLVGHNIKKFDMPWIVRRALINGITVPTQFYFQKQKPWENCLLDTLEVWKFGGIYGAPLDLICGVLNIPSPKDAMKNTEVSENYWAGKSEEIKNYCEGDILATMNVMLKISNLQII